MKFSMFQVTALAVIGTAGLVSLATSPYFAANAADTTTAPQGQNGPIHHHKHGPMQGPLLMAVHQLNLTPEQQQSVHSILESARQQHRSQVSVGHPDITVIGNPGDPGYPAAIQKAKTDAASHVQQRSDLDVQIYAVLTLEQKAKLPQVLADIRTKMKARHQQGATNQTSTVSS